MLVYIKVMLIFTPTKEINITKIRIMATLTTQDTNKLTITYSSAKMDIQGAWDNPTDGMAKISRSWIYAVDPETMQFVKAVFKCMPGHFSLYDTFVEIMKCKTLEILLNKVS